MNEPGTCDSYEGAQSLRELWRSTEPERVREPGDRELWRSPRSQWPPIESTAPYIIPSFKARNKSTSQHSPEKKQHLQRRPSNGTKRYEKRHKRHLEISYIGASSRTEGHWIWCGPSPLLSTGFSQTLRNALWRISRESFQVKITPNWRKDMTQREVNEQLKWKEQFFLCALLMCYVVLR